MFPISMLGGKFFEQSAVIFTPDSVHPAFNCHHCGNRKRADFLLHCKQRFFPKNSKADKIKQCRKKFCHSCLRKHYNQLVFNPADAESSTGIVFQNSDEAEEFLERFESKLVASGVNLPIFTSSNRIENNSNYLVSSVPVNLTFNPSKKTLESAIKFESWTCPACNGICLCFGCKPVKAIAKLSSKSLTNKDSDSDVLMEKVAHDDKPYLNIPPVNLPNRSNNLFVVRNNSNNLSDNLKLPLKTYSWKDSNFTVVTPRPIRIRSQSLSNESPSLMRRIKVFTPIARRYSDIMNVNY